MNSSNRPLNGTTTANRAKSDVPVVLKEMLKGGLLILWRGCEYARNLGLESWEFAVEQESLARAGLLPIDLHWLMSRGYVEVAPRVTSPLGRHGLAQHCNGSCEEQHACFFLTKAGVAYVSPILADGSPPSRRLPVEKGNVGDSEEVHDLAHHTTGDMVALAGVGARFNGNVLVTGVRHDYDLVHGWKTNVQFGGLESDGPATNDRSAPPAGGLLPRVSGLQIGVVVSNEDPDGEHRVRIRLPLVSDDDGIWARVASLDAGSDRGFFFRPEIGDEVVAGFLDEDPRCAVILGMLHSSAKAAPLPGSDKNHKKAYKSRSGMQFTVADYRKLLIDLPEVRNAWISPHPLRYFTDTIHKRLWRDDPGTFGIRPVNSHGVYDIRLGFMDEVTTPEKRQAVIAGAMRVLQANRNLCEDFVSIPSAATAKRRAIIPSSTISRRSTASPMRVCLRKRMPCSANARASRTRTTATPIKKSVSCYGHRPPGLWVAACRGERRRRDQGQPGRRQCATEVRAPLHGAPLRRELQQGPRPYGRPRRQTQSPSQRPRVHRRQSGLFRRRPVPAGKPGRAGAHCPRINAHDSAGRGRAT